MSPSTKEIKILKVIVIITVMIIMASLINSFVAITVELKEKKDRIDSLLKPTPFLVERLNEHDVLLINKKDTIHLYFENSYELNEEVIFVKFKK